MNSHGEDVIAKLAALDAESSSTVLPPDGEMTKRSASRLDDLRRLALESLRMALQDGEHLIHNLTELKNQGTLDSRPAHILPAVNTGDYKQHVFEIQFNPYYSVIDLIRIRNQL